MNIKEIEIGTDYFYKTCDYLEKHIVKENLKENGGTLNYEDLTYDSDILLVAFDNNKPIGFNSIIITPEGYYIYQIAVKKKYKNKGVGTKLMKVIIDKAEKEGALVNAHVMGYNENSQSMFKNLGFTKISEDPITTNGFYTSDKEKYFDLLNNSKKL